MKPEDRFKWIEAYLARTTLRSINVVDAFAVNEYIEATDAKFAAMPFGASRCPRLGRDLSAMYRAGRLRRRCCGLTEMRGYGFPAWVWDYLLPQ